MVGGNFIHKVNEAHLELIRASKARQPHMTGQICPRTAQFAKPAAKLGAELSTNKAGQIIKEANTGTGSKKQADLVHIHELWKKELESYWRNWNMLRYCYLLNDLTPDLLASKCATYEDLKNYLRFCGREAYLKKRCPEKAPGLMKEAERFLILSNKDRLWKEHLQALKFVQQAVGLHGYAQRDPLIEYKLEGYNLFIEMMAQIRRNVIYSIYQFKPVMVKDPVKPDDANGTVHDGIKLGTVESSPSSVARGSSDT